MEGLKIGLDLDGVILTKLFFIKKDANRILRLLLEKGHTIKIVSARGNRLTLFQAKIMLKIHGLGNLPVVGVGKNGNKFEQLADFDIFVDNKTRHLLAIDGRVKNLFLFGKKPTENFKNLKNWWDIYWEVVWLSGVK